jgi:hypothetical protein
MFDIWKQRHVKGTVSNGLISKLAYLIIGIKRAISENFKRK